MLTTSQTGNGFECQLLGSPSSCYSHLIGAASSDLELATCIYFDGIAQNFPIRSTLDLIESWFSERASKPKVVLAGKEGVKKLPRYTVRSMRSAASADEAGLRRSFDTLQFFPKGRTTVDSTWRPSVYFAVSTRRPASAFYCTSEVLDESWVLAHLLQGAANFRSVSAYGFWFPEKFSPLAYFWGMSVEPAGPWVGAWGKRESRRLSHWRDNTQIGIQTGDQRRFFSSCDGYVRDAYPLMLLSAKHFERHVGDSTLGAAIGERHLGSISAKGERFLWRIPSEKLAEAQALLDSSDISLSGRRLERGDRFDVG
jgi:hypothetical protein